MLKRAQEIIEQLQLKPHPEGGYFNELFRSEDRVQPQDKRSLRNGLTIIYFLLTGDEISRWHRVKSDEAWHFLEGDPLQLYKMDQSLNNVTEFTLSSLSDNSRPTQVIPANNWQAAQCGGRYSLVSCSVGPGFDFQDFEMMSNTASKANQLKQKQPQFTDLL